MSPYITAEEAAKRAGLSTSDLATIRWNPRRNDERGPLRWVFLAAGQSAKPLYDEASVAAYVESQAAVAVEALA